MNTNKLKSQTNSSEESEEREEIVIDNDTRETEDLSYAEYESHYDDIWSNMFHNHKGVFYNLDETATVSDKVYKDAS